MANISSEVIEARIREYGKLWTMDDLVRERAKDEHQVPILGYPKKEDEPANYEYFTGKDLDRMVDEACRTLIGLGFEVNSRKPIALFAESNLPFIITYFALFRLGCKVLTMSIRLSEPACLHLLKETNCKTVVYGKASQVTRTLPEMQKARPDITYIPIPSREHFDKPDSPAEPFYRHIEDLETEHVQQVMWGHSSGSTGLPKPLPLAHRSIINTMMTGTGCKAFNALPWYHLHGLFTSTMAMWMRKTAHLFNATLPLTADNLIAALKEVQPEICHTVPFALELIAERQDGIDILKKCKYVTAAGARTVDEIGDRLIENGVPFGCIFGLTEVGHMGDSIKRDPGDDSWNYIRPYAHIRQHMFFKEVGEGMYEAMYLKSHPALLKGNSDDPPGSFHSKDLFTPHPTIENAWKSVARADDRITLKTGEKILPLAMEGTIRESPLVRDALMVGNDELQPGLLVFRNPAFMHLSEEEFIEALWPKVKVANRLADQFARITPDMIAPIPADIPYPATDKSNIIRAAAYAKFAEQIKNMYRDSGKSKNLQLSVPELETFLLKLIRDYSDINVPDIRADFYAAGVDSLVASQLRRLLLSNLDVGGHQLATNVVYDNGNVARLARHLHFLRTGEKAEDENTSDESEIEAMGKMFKSFDTFTARQPGPQPLPEKDTVVLTGATGALGAHLLDQLLDDPKVERIYALVRGPADAQARLAESLRIRGLSLTRTTSASTSTSTSSDGDDENDDNDDADAKPPCAPGKLTALTTDDLSLPDLGLAPEAYATLQATTTLVIHAAWPVNFNISLASLRPHVAGLRRLLALSLAVPFARPAHLVFASSVSTAFATTPRPAVIAERPLASWRQASPRGYARSKLVGERLCAAAAAAAGARVIVLRVGQIAADSRWGIWNEREHIPLMVRSARELGAMPRLDDEGGAGGGYYEGRCEWMPVDTVARTFLELAEAMKKKGGGGDAKEEEAEEEKEERENEATFYNVVPPHAFSWNEEFLPALARAGLRFETVGFGEWMRRMRQRAAELGAGDEAEKRIPGLRLAGYYEEVFGGERGSLVLSEGEGEGEEGKKKIGEKGGKGRGGDLRFSCERACRDSEALRNCPKLGREVGMVRKMLVNWGMVGDDDDGYGDGEMVRVEGGKGSG
ncbi:hypothetical protein F4778DRAFT_787662 [Xylariomycetidae sp. FL2044]|nr:hypothetical protein F4778DRAFT_787662 [Xylariomycetidae sp. FL2044]